MKSKFKNHKESSLINIKISLFKFFYNNAVIHLSGYFIYKDRNRIDGVMVSVLTSSAVDRGFKRPRYLLLLC